MLKHPEKRSDNQSGLLTGAGCPYGAPPRTGSGYAHAGSREEAEDGSGGTRPDTGRGGREAQQTELSNTIDKLQRLQANVTISAENGVKEAIKGIGTGLNDSLKVEVDKTRTTLRGMAEDLEKVSSWLTWRWIFAYVILGIAVGYTSCWAMWTKDLAAVEPRLDAIEQTLKQLPTPQSAAQPGHQGQQRSKLAQAKPIQPHPTSEPAQTPEEKP